MINCEACGEKIRTDRYCWNLSWDRLSQYSYAKRKFTVSFHNKPQCIMKMSERMDAWSWELGMIKAFKDTEVTVDYYVEDEV